MPDDSAHVPAMVRHHAAYLRAWLNVTPQTNVDGNRAELRLNFGNKMFVAVFGCRKKPGRCATSRSAEANRPPPSPAANWSRRWPRYSATNHWHPPPRRSAPPPGHEPTPPSANGAPR